MRSQQSGEIWQHGVFREVDRSERLDGLGGPGRDIDGWTQCFDKLDEYLEETR